MNEEIKALIERETKEYSERIKKNTNFNSNERIAATAAFNRGANIISEAITNLFRWKKVSEEPPEVKDKPYQINIRVIGIPMSTSVWNIRKESDLAVFSNMKGCEWMPIPEGGSK